jgi:hypothetical protein
MMDNLIAYLICFSLGALITYVDISSFFSERKVGAASIIRVFSADLFISANGLIGLAILAWSLSDPTAKINSVLPFESAIGKALIIGISIPALIRSKWFTVMSRDEKTNPAGFEAIYLWFKDQVLMKVLNHSLIRKDKICIFFAKKLEGDKSVPEKVHERVAEIIGKIKIELLPEREKEYKNIEQAYSDDPASFEHLKKLFNWAIDSTNISLMKAYFKQLVAENLE